MRAGDHGSLLEVGGAGSARHPRSALRRPIPSGGTDRGRIHHGRRSVREQSWPDDVKPAAVTVEII